MSSRSGSENDQSGTAYVVFTVAKTLKKVLNSSHLEYPTLGAKATTPVDIQVSGIGFCPLIGLSEGGEKASSRVMTCSPPC